MRNIIQYKSSKGLVRCNVFDEAYSRIISWYCDSLSSERCRTEPVFLVYVNIGRILIHSIDLIQLRYEKNKTLEF